MPIRNQGRAPELPPEQVEAIYQLVTSPAFQQDMLAHERSRLEYYQGEAALRDEMYRQHGSRAGIISFDLPPGGIHAIQCRIALLERQVATQERNGSCIQTSNPTLT